MSDYYYFSINAGWGDTLWNLVNAILYCRKHDKTLLLDLRGHWAGSKEHNCFHDYFYEMAYCPYITDVKEINKLCKGAERHCKENLIIKSPSKSEEDRDLFFQVFCGISPKAHIKMKINQFSIDNFEDKYVIGIHARTSNGEKFGRFGEQKSIQDMFQEYKKSIDSIMFSGNNALMKVFKNYCFFVASDSQAFVKEVEKEYKNVYSLSRFYPKPGSGTGHEIGEKITDQDKQDMKKYGQINIATEALIDFYLLQRGHFLFKNWSRFNEFCLFKGIPYYHIKFQNKCY